MNDIELNRELRELRNERRLNEQILRNHQENMKRMLRGDLGKDMQNVLSGKTKVKLSFFEKLKYKVDFYIKKIFTAL